MRFDASRILKGLEAMGKEAKKADKLMNRQGRFFVAFARKVSLENAPDPISILDLEQKLGGRLKRKPGVTVPQEIGRRILMIGTLARNWRFWKMEKVKGIIRVYIRDRVNYSKVVDDRQHLGDKAAALTAKKFYPAINRFRDAIVRRFQNG